MSTWRLERGHVVAETPVRRTLALATVAAPLLPIAAAVGRLLSWEPLFMGAWVAAWLFLLGSAIAPFVVRGAMRLPWTGTREIELTDDDRLVLRKADGTLQAVRSLLDFPLVWRDRGREARLLAYDGSELCVGLPTAREADALVEAIRRRTLRRCRAYSLRVDGHVARLSRGLWGWGTFSAVGTTLALLGAPGMAAAAGVGALAWWAATSPRRVTFGADGITVRGRLRRRFVPYREVESVDVRSRGLRSAVRLRLHGGGSVVVGRFFDAGRAHLARGLLEEGLAMVESGRQAGAEVSDLAHAGEELEPFVARLRTLTRGSYRSATLSPERLFDVMRNPAAEPAQRASAAVALRNDPRGVARIRVAADVSADPDVRSAFEQLAAEEGLDEQRLEQLLTRVSRPR